MTPTEPTGTPRDASASPRRAATLGGCLAIALSVLPLAAAAVLLCMAGLPDYALDGDGALVELRIAEATRFNQLLGSYSRLGFEHPGALHLYLCAPFYAAFDGRTGALNLAVLVLQAAALATSLILGLRAAGAATALAGTVAASLYIASLGQTLMTVWDPAMAILPLWTCIAAAGFAVGGRPWAALAAVLAGSFAVQAHLSLVPPVAVALGVLALFVLATWGRASADARRAYATSVAAGLLSIAPTLWEQIAADPGNLTRIAEALGAEGPRPGVSEALRITAEQLSAPIRDAAGLDADLAPAFAALQVFAGAAAVWAARRRRAHALAGLGIVALAVQVAAPIAVLRIVGEIRPHMLQWIATAGALGLWPVIATLWTCPGAATRVGRTIRIATTTAAALVAVYAGGTRLAAQTLVFIQSIERDPGAAAGTPGLALLLDEIQKALPEDTSGVRLRLLAADAPLPGYPDFTAGSGLVLGLKKRGLVVAPEPAHAFAYPRRMELPDERAAHVVVHDPTNVGRLVDPTAAVAARDYGIVGFSVFASEPSIRTP